MHQFSRTAEISTKIAGGGILFLVHSVVCKLFTEYVDEELFGGVACDVAGDTLVRADVNQLHVVKTKSLCRVVDAQVRMIDERDDLTVAYPTHGRLWNARRRAVDIHRVTDHHRDLLDHVRLIDVCWNCICVQYTRIDRHQQTFSQRAVLSGTPTKLNTLCYIEYLITSDLICH